MLRRVILTALSGILAACSANPGSPEASSSAPLSSPPPAVAPSTPAPSPSAGVDQRRLDTANPGYERGVLLLKLRETGPGAAVDPRDFSRPAGPRSTLPRSLQDRNKAHGLLTAAPLFDAAQVTSSQIRARFSQRARRAPNAAAPKLDRIVKLTFASQLDMERVARDYAADPVVEFAEPNRVVRALFTPNDQYFNATSAWGLTNIGATTAWDTATGAGVTVAVIDTGIELAHPDLAANLWTNSAEVAANSVDDDGNGYVDDTVGWDFANNDNSPADGNGHGTHVSGTIAAVANNTNGVAGLAFGARLMPLKGLNDGGSGYLTDLALALSYAIANGADVINNSWGGPGRDATIEATIDFAHAMGVVTVSAGGNDNVETYGFSPANAENSLTVSAFKINDTRASFSNFGVKVDVAAPGGQGGSPSSLSASTDILSTAPQTSVLASFGYPISTDLLGKKYMPLAGTSMASPHVAALAALVIEAHPSWTNEEIRQAIRQSAVDVTAPGFDTDSGFGRINAAAALALGAVALPTASIILPYNGKDVSGTVSVDGFTGAAPSLTSTYALQMGAGALPSSFATFASGSGPVSGGSLGSLNTLNYPDGPHTVRVVTTDSNAKVSEDRNLVFVNNVFIQSPADGAYLSSASVGVTGMAAGNTGFINYTLEWAPGCNASSGFTSITSSSSQVNPVAALGTWSLAAVPDGAVTLRLTANFSTHTSQDQKCVVVDHALAPGFPAALNHVPTFKSPKFADLDNDGTHEIVVGASVFEPNGSLRAGWTNFPGLGRTNPAILDVDADGQLEVVAADFDGNTSSPNAGAPVIYAYRPDKTVLWSTPVVNPAATLPDYNYGVPSTISAADVDGDGQTEIVFSIFFNYFNPSYETQIFILDAATGSLENSFAVPGVSQSSVALADLDGNGAADLVIETYDHPAGTGTVHVLDSSGAPLSGWPQTITGSVEGFANIDPVISDVDRDGTYDILVGKNLFRYDGTQLTGWPIAWIARSTGALAQLADDDCPLEVVTGGGNSIVFGSHEHDGTMRGIITGGPENVYVIMAGENGLQGNPVVADVDGDGQVDVIRPHELGIQNPLTPLRLYGASGSTLGSVAGFPRYVPNPSDIIRATPAIGDVDGDGQVDMALTVGGQLYLWHLNQPYSVSKSPWPMFQHDLRNTGTLPILGPCGGGGGGIPLCGEPGVGACGPGYCDNGSFCDDCQCYANDALISLVMCSGATPPDCGLGCCQDTGAGSAYCTGPHCAAPVCYTPSNPISELLCGGAPFQEGCGVGKCIGDSYCDGCACYAPWHPMSQLRCQSKQPGPVKDCKDPTLKSCGPGVCKMGMFCDGCQCYPTDSPVSLVMCSGDVDPVCGLGCCEGDAYCTGANCKAPVCYAPDSAVSQILCGGVTVPSGCGNGKCIGDSYCDDCQCYAPEHPLSQLICQ